jgi:hypothetical protein
MPIPFTCPHCGHQTQVPEEYAGQSGPCVKCGQTIAVPPLASPWQCPQCRTPLAPGLAACTRCGVPLLPTGGAPPNIGEDAGVRMLIPVGRSPLAIVAGYVGLLSPLMAPAPIALLLGILAIRDIKKHPNTHGMGRAIFAVVMGAIFSLVLLFALVGWGMS